MLWTSMPEKAFQSPRDIIILFMIILHEKAFETLVAVYGMKLWTDLDRAIMKAMEGKSCLGAITSK